LTSFDSPIGITAELTNSITRTVSIVANGQEQSLDEWQMAAVLARKGLFE
jgi:hypothetical protein